MTALALLIALVLAYVLGWRTRGLYEVHRAAERRRRAETIAGLRSKGFIDGPG